MNRNTGEKNARPRHRRTEFGYAKRRSEVDVVKAAASPPHSRETRATGYGHDALPLTHFVNGGTLFDVGKDTLV